jgi:hypothetical protein
VTQCNRSSQIIFASNVKKYSEILERSNDYDGELMSLLKRDFQYLESDFSMACIELSNGFKYESGKTNIFVLRLPWQDGTVWVGIDRRTKPFGDPKLGLPVWAVMNARKSKYLYNDIVKTVDKFPLYALAVRECCSDMLMGDFSNVGGVIDWMSTRDEQRREWTDRLMNASDESAKKRPPKLP